MIGIFVIVNQAGFVVLMWDDAFGVSLLFMLITFAAISSPFSKIFSVLCTLLSQILPFVIFQNPAAASLLSVMSIFYSFRQFEMSKNISEKPFKDFTWPVRVIFVFLFYDLRTSLRCDPSTPLIQRRQMISDFLGMLLCAAIGIGGGHYCLTKVYEAELNHFSLLYCLGRMYLWAVVCASMIIFVDLYYAASFQAFGYVVQKSFVEPWKAASLAEFWGKRWNRVVQRTLHYSAHHFLRPYIGDWAIIGTFCVSGILHCVPVAVALSYTDLSTRTMIFATVSMFSFFPLQGFLVLFERKAKIEKLSPSFARLFALLTLFMTVPLATEAFFLIFRPHYDFPCLKELIGLFHI